MQMWTTLGNPTVQFFVKFQYGGAGTNFCRKICFAHNFFSEGGQNNLLAGHTWANVGLSDCINFFENLNLVSLLTRSYSYSRVEIDVDSLKNIEIISSSSKIMQIVVTSSKRVGNHFLFSSKSIKNVFRFFGSY